MTSRDDKLGDRRQTVFVTEHHLNEVRKHFEWLVKKYAAAAFRNTNTEAGCIWNDAVNLANGIQQTQSSTAATTVYQAPSECKLLPKRPTDDMLRAIDAFFDKWQRITGTSDQKRKASCWDALNVYEAMYEGAPITESLPPSATMRACQPCGTSWSAPVEACPKCGKVPQSAEALAAGMTFCCAREEAKADEIGKLRNVIQQCFSVPEVKAAWDRIMNPGRPVPPHRSGGGHWVGEPR